MILSRYTLKNIQSAQMSAPAEDLLELPEKVLQFGTGVLLRALPGYFIDKANKQGVFNGRIVMVKSTTQGNDATAFENQDGLYTLCVRGIEDGRPVHENIINASVSRVIEAQQDWPSVLECAHNQQLQIIISNTTEVGIQLVNDDIRRHPPVSFPGKLLAFLYERFKAFNGSPASGMVIVPTELLPGNGKILESIVLELAHLNGLQADFIEWLEQHNHFCNSLVDRIVPGRPSSEQAAAMQTDWGYKDSLITMTEHYRLWAIEGDEHIAKILSFATVDEGVIVTPNIQQHRELKLRLLNGTHTLSCALAFLAGEQTVKSAMENPAVAGFIHHLMMEEIAPSIPHDITLATAHVFGEKVLDRFRNPHIEHYWLNISMQYTSKLRMRCVPILLKHYEQFECPPQTMALGFAAYLVFMQPTKKSAEQFTGHYNGYDYTINDDAADYFYRAWQGFTPAALVHEVLSNTALWDEDLSVLPGFSEAVLQHVLVILQDGVVHAIEQLGHAHKV
ncbi:tagaturonate reductase [Chitinophaga skermanii]|uniref:Tagaturonate reductase n=1 Tax=Chitinophaga skermanii TaxID=331697 RepID=A0A327QNU1_9BACT|nr:tagaturonate reductase [Chitinophaga skermanii]RAJ05322.1 tagaturonate reductase [Chitinophaga skermanii]